MDSVHTAYAEDRADFDHIHIYIFIYIHTYILTLEKCHTHSATHTRTHTRKHTHTHTLTFTLTHVHTHTQIFPLHWHNLAVRTEWGAQVEFLNSPLSFARTRSKCLFSRNLNPVALAQSSGAYRVGRSGRISQKSAFY